MYDLIVMVKRFSTFEINRVFEDGERVFNTVFDNFTVYKQPARKSGQKIIKEIDKKKEMKKLKCKNDNDFLLKYFRFKEYEGTYYVKKTIEWWEADDGKQLKKKFNTIVVGGETKKNDKIKVYKRYKRK